MKRKYISDRLCGLVAIVLMASCLWSCSKTDSGSGSGLIELAGEDFTVVSMARPVDILRSAGAEVENGRVVLPQSLTDGPLHASDMHVLKTLCEAKGLALDNLLSLAYYNPRMSAMVLAVTDSGALASSLGGAGWTGVKCDGGEVYTHDAARSVSLMCDGEYLWIVRRGEADAVAKDVEALKGRAARPLPSWLADKLAAVGDEALRMAYQADTTRVFVAAMGLHGPSMTIDVRCAAKTDGAPRTFFEPDSACTLGNAAAYVSRDDVVSLGVALPRGFQIARLIQEIDYTIYSMPGVADAVRQLDGRLVLSAGIIDPSSLNVMDISNYRVSLALGTGPGHADELLKILRQALGHSSYLPLDMHADGDLVLIDLNGGCRGDKAAAGGEMALLSANLPSDSPLARMAGLPCGFTVKGDADNDAARLEIAFSDSDRGFVATLLDIISIID
ncbi:MAG: hypothetical protein Q4C34_00545 [Bacteroidales bacterium]|nr:hypothetical protein [Bacteroidales bacterium]